MSTPKSPSADRHLFKSLIFIMKNKSKIISLKAISMLFICFLNAAQNMAMQEEGYCYRDTRSYLKAKLSIVCSRNLSVCDTGRNVDVSESPYPCPNINCGEKEVPESGIPIKFPKIEENVTYKNIFFGKNKNKNLQ